MNKFNNFSVPKNYILIRREEYLPYGQTSFGGYLTKKYRYTGKEKDEESGLYYYGARYYAPWMARFTSVDPLYNKNLFFNPFHYCSCDPINRVDPSGMVDEKVTDTEKKQTASAKTAAAAAVGSVSVSSSKKVHNVIVRINDKGDGRIVTESKAYEKGNWLIIQADDISSAYNEIQKKVGNSKIDNLIFDVHGSLGENKMALDTDKPQMTQEEITNYISFSGLNTNSADTNNQIKAFDSLLDMVKNGGNVIVMACLGQKEARSNPIIKTKSATLGQAINNLSEKRLNIYTSSGFTSEFTMDYEKQSIDLNVQSNTLNTGSTHNLPDKTYLATQFKGWTKSNNDGSDSILSKKNQYLSPKINFFNEQKTIEFTPNAPINWFRY